MYARSTTIHADPQRIDAGIAHVRDEVMPAVQDMEGCVGLSMICDRDSGRCIITTSWESEEAMRATTERVRDLRQRAADMLGGEFDVQEWEIAAMHRVHPAGDQACTRVIWTRGDPAQAESGIDSFRMAMLPRMEELPGFCSVSLMVDRQSGRAATAVTYDSRQDMAAGMEKAVAMREEFTRQMNMEVTEVGDFDLVLAHLRVPEMA